ncbi:MAG: L-glutamate gamma-semialdehyde dehydrogenase [Myxococcaceae bacterium]
MRPFACEVPLPRNEPVLGYAPGSPERAALKAALASTAKSQVDIPIWISGQRHKGKTQSDQRMPHRHAHVLAKVHDSSAEHVQDAITAALGAKPAWAALPFSERAAIFLKAADLLSTRYRYGINATTMLGQSKTAAQAELDAACETIDFLRFNVSFASRILADQPQSSPGVWNQLDYRPLDGFVFAVAPFNFTAIGVNLCTAPALMGNTVILKPAPGAALSTWLAMEVLQEAGLPNGVVNFVPGDGPTIGNAVLASPDLGGIHFTGSTGVFQQLWRQVGERIQSYRQYPRVVGETGGKDFIFVHASAEGELDALATAIVRAGYECQGQKCSACSRVYVPKRLWGPLQTRLAGMISELRVGDVSDFRNFMGALIDERAFKKVTSYLELAKNDAQVEVVAGGTSESKEGWFVAPTLLRVDDPNHRLMREEIFGPVVSVFVYPDDQYEETLALCDRTAPYALTGSIFARDRAAVETASRVLRHAAGNFYINDKPTGAVVGQQPFGGGRASGTNDKAGSALNLLRWTSPRTIKEAFTPPTSPSYPSQSEA